MESLPQNYEERIKHHTVPERYLRNFCDGNGQMMHVRLDHPEWARPRSPRSLTMVRHFYTIKTEGYPPDTFERILAEREAWADKAFDWLKNGRWPLLPDDRNAMANWLGLQSLRSRTQRQLITDTLRIHAEMFTSLDRQSFRAALEDALKRQVTDDEAQEYWDYWAEVVPSRELATGDDHARFIAESSQGAFLTIRRYRWGILNFERTSLITSDNPIAMLSDAEALGLSWGPTFPQVVGFAFPVSRHVGLIAIEGIGPDFAWRPTRHIARVMNQVVAHRAQHAVFHHPDDDISYVKLPPPNSHRFEAEL